MTFTVNCLYDAPPDLPDGSNAFRAFSPLSQLLVIASCNNKAQFEALDEKHVDSARYMDSRKVLGDATDSGLLRFCDRLVDVDATRGAFGGVYAIPFNSKNKWALTMCKIPGDMHHYLVTIKGAPEFVMKRCVTFSYKGKELPIDEDFREDMTEAYMSFGVMAERVIGHAYKIVPRSAVPTMPSNQEEAEAAGLVNGFTFCGLLSLIDPPRDAVPPAVLECRRAGIAVTMVTGDHPLTAEAIARKCNIITQPTRREIAAELGVDEQEVPFSEPRVRALVISGDMVNEIQTDEDWDVVMEKDELVFARTTPQQKLLIVQHFQRRGEVVAVTGDGVNDSPALRKADIGVAMGNPESSEVAREAADIVLLDDDFASLVAAIGEGRTLYDNLKKTIAYTLAHVPPEMFPVVLFLVFGMPLGLSAMLLIAIDLIAEQGPASSLAVEPAEASAMERPPRDVNAERLVSVKLLMYSYCIVGIAEALCCMGAYLWVFTVNGVPHSEIFLISPKRLTWLVVADWNYGPVFIGDREISVEEQQEIARQASAAWYITLTLCQFWHIWFCKTRRESVFRHRGVFTNRASFYGVSLALTLMLCCAYIPYLQEHIFYTANPPGKCAWVPHFFFAVFIVTYTESVKRQARHHPNSFVARYLAW